MASETIREQFSFNGFCPICERPAVFIATHAWFRESLICQSCPGGSVPRERALALVLNERRPDWRNLAIHESSPAPRGISVKLASEATGYIGSQYFPGECPGAITGGFRNENLEYLTFENAAFDITITLDVMEHVYHPDKVIREIHRTLTRGGLYLCTFPVRKHQVAAWERRFELLPDGTRKDFKEVEIHGNPVSRDGSIVTVDWGYDLHQQIAAWAPFDITVYRFANETHGILGEYTDVIACRKR